MNTLLSDILDSYRDEMIGTLRKLLQIPTVLSDGQEGAPFGEPIRQSLEFIMALGRDKGFECVNFDNYAGEINIPLPKKQAIGPASNTTGPSSDTAGLGKTFPRTDSTAVGVVSHLDVVPPGSGWTYDPFGGTLVDNKIWGRGAVDDKGPLVAAFYACCAIKDSGLPLSKVIKHIIGTNEESGSFPCIEYYKSHAAVPACGIVPDAWFPAVFAEKGFLNFEFYKKIDPGSPACSAMLPARLISLSGGDALNMVPASASAELSVKDECGAGKQNTEAEHFAKMMSKILEADGHKKNIAIEWNGNNITISSKGTAAHASAPELGINAISILLNYIAALPSLPGEPWTTLRGLSAVLGQDTDGKGLDIGYTDHTGDTTVNIGRISYDNAFLSVKLNIRFPVTFAVEALEKKLGEKAAALGMHYRRINYNPHFYIAPDHPLITLLSDVYRDMTGDLISKPKAHGGGSYARILNGFVPFGPSMQNEELCFHKQDEFISCERLLLLSKIYAEALYRLAGQGGDHEYE